MSLGPVRLLTNAPQNTLTENRCWMWQCVTWCRFSGAQDC